MTGLLTEFDRIAIVSPVFNDWVCADELVARLAALSDELPAVAVVLVDDGSTDSVEMHPHQWPEGLESVDIVHSGANVGHQRAIAIGLAHVITQVKPDAVVVIDADGEDDPSDIPFLLAQLNIRDTPPSTPPQIVVAQRKGRTEARSFRAFYRLYKAGFYLLTGRRMDFGNFSAMTSSAATRLLYMPELWNHFPATVMRSRISTAKVPTDRSHRFHGESRMNFVSLVNHGLAAIATFSDVVFARLLIAMSVVVGALVAAGMGVAAVRLFSTVAIPGWATAAMGFVLLALFQFLALVAVMTFIQLAARSNVPAIPIKSVPSHSRSVERIYP